jgi:hypothetical protein
MWAEAKPLASDAALDDVNIDTEEASDEPRVGNSTRKGERDRGNSGASQDGAQGASDEEMKESAEPKAEGLSNSSDRNTGGWAENAEDDEERREVKGRARVTPKAKGAFQPGSRAALSKVHLTASAGFFFFLNQYVAVRDNLLIGDQKCRARVGTKEKERKGKRNRRKGTKKKWAMYMIYRSMMMRRKRRTTVRSEIGIDTDTASSSN